MIILAVNRERAIKFLEKLIKQNTVNPPGNENIIVNIISEHVRKYDLNVKIKALTSNRSNIIIKLKGNNSKLKPLIFSGHLDTVPIGDIRNWKVNPFSEEISDGNIYGRGSCDMKSGVAGLIEAMINIQESGETPEASIIFVGTAGAEVDCIGAKKIVEEKSIEHAGAMVIAEASNNRVYSAHKGVLWIEILIYGKTAHGSAPSEGVNAINHAMEVLRRLKSINLFKNIKHDLLGRPTFNISMIEGEVQTNVVPDQCRITIDDRTIPGIENEKVVKEFKEILQLAEREIKHFRAQLNVLHNLPYFHCPKHDKFLKLALDLNKKVTGIDEKEKGANYYTE